MGIINKNIVDFSAIATVTIQANIANYYISSVFMRRLKHVSEKRRRMLYLHRRAGG